MFYILRIAANFFIAHHFLDNFYPQQYRSFVLFSASKMIYFYTWVEFYLKKYMDKNKNIKKILDYFNIFGKKHAEIEFVIFNQVLSSMTKDVFLETKNNENIIPFEFVLYSSIDNTQTNKETTNHCIYHTLEDVENKLTTVEKCDYKFFTMSVSIKDVDTHVEKTYNLILKNDRENYYMVGNKINKVFICYWLFQKYGLDFDWRYITYRMDLLDNEFKIFSLTEDECIVFSKDSYDVIKFNNPQDDLIEKYEYELDEKIKINEDEYDDMPELISSENLEELQLDMNNVVERIEPIRYYDDNTENYEIINGSVTNVEL